MSLHRSDIPWSVLVAAKRAGLTMPDWYVGQRRRDQARRITLASIVADVERRAST